MKIISWNTKGLRSPNKRIKILRFLGKYRPDVVFLQETHLLEADFSRMHKLWVGQIYGSPAAQGKAGVITLINKNFAHSLLSHTHDSEGRESIVKLMHEGTELVLCNIYGPNGENRVFYDNLGVKLRSIPSGSLIMGGDLNTVLSPGEDRQGHEIMGRPPTQSRPSDRVLPSFLRVTGLRDVWRETHPEGRDFTFFSHARQTWSRIDYFLLPTQLMPRVQNMTIGPLVISDHSPLILQLSDTYPRGSDFLWRFPTYLAKEDSFSALLRGWWLEYSSANETHLDNPPLYWHASKAVLRGKILAFTKAHKKKTQLAFEEASVTGLHNV